MPFTPINTLVGGALLHVSTSSLLADTGRVLGISGILESGIYGVDAKWQRAVLLGLLLGPALGSLAGLQDVYAGEALLGWAGISASRAAAAGLLVGFGSRLGSGCTSGHFLCGVSRGSKRSLAATATFFSAALITANLTLTPSTTLKPAYTPEYPSHRGRVTLFLTFATLRLAHSTLQHYLSGVKAPSTAQRYATYLLSGLTFSIGLLVSGMADPRKVLSFLTISHLPSFDPSLGMVVLSGVIPNAVHWYNTPKGKARLSWEKWSVPTRQDIDYRLILGSALFGIGWGLAGVCPGPALVGAGQTVVSAVQDRAVATVAQSISAFLGAMVAGMALVRLV